MLGLFLQPNAAATISAMAVDPVVKKHALDVVLKGYTVIPATFSAARCAEAIAGFHAFERANEAIFTANRDARGHYPRIVNLHTALPELAHLFTDNHATLAVQDLLFGAPTALYTSLFYETGSQQPLHRDTPVFSTRPEYLYFGTTVYLEPAGAENGCLEVMEFGHLMRELDREAMARARYGSMDTLPDMDEAIWNDYQKLVTDTGRGRGLSVRALHVNAGDTVIWHPQLPHGGSPIRDPSRTRFSLVMHVTPEGVPVYHQKAFFNPNEKLPEVAPWSYKTVRGRRVADFRHGIGFGHTAQYRLDELRAAEPVAA